MIKVHNNASTHRARASGAASSGSESDVILLPFSRFYPEHRGESLLCDPRAKAGYQVVSSHF